jgi:perosamine synthetase
LTDASVFSFSTFKLLNYVWGGLITTRDPDIAHATTETVEAWPRLAAHDFLAPALSCLRYDVASRPLLFKSVVLSLIRRKVQRSAAAKDLERMRIETTGISRTLTSRPSLAAFAEWARKLPSIDGWLAQRRHLAAIYRRRLGHRMVGAETPEAILVGSCFVNFPVIVPQDRCAEIARAMILAGYDVGRSLYPNVHRHPKFTSVSGASDNVDDLVASFIYLPTHFGVPDDYAEAIAHRLSREIGDET